MFDVGSKLAMVLIAFYLGGMAGFLGGYLVNASILRSYREEADELRHRLGASFHRAS